jgi:hypothetical protein
MNRTLRTTVVATTALAVALVAGAPADAAVKPLDAAKKAVTSRIDKRLTALKDFTATLGKAKQVQAGHRGTLTTLIGGQVTGLTALRAKVSTETTAAAVKTDAHHMINDYRVFILTGPKVRLTAAIDTELAVVDKLHDRANVDDAKLDAVAKSLDGQVGNLLSIEPGPDGDAIRARVKTVRQAARDARTSLKPLRKSK